MTKKWLFPVMVFLIGFESVACNVPVFRYALERWQQEQYIVSYIHDGSAPIDEKQVAALAGYCTDEVHGPESGTRANARCVVIAADSSLSGEERMIVGREMPDKFPEVRVNFPFAAGIRAPLWRGDPHAPELPTVLASPLRENIVTSILSGTTAIWVFIECGNRTEDRKYLALLKKELDKGEKTITLPELSQQDSMDYLPDGSPELRIDFEIMRVSRNDPQEKMFISMIEAMEPPIRSMRDKPIAFAVFGRGRYLHALVGKGINAQTIEQTNRYITGPCACTVKAENPGKDLLLPDRWESGIRKKFVHEIKPPEKLFGIGQFLPRERKPEGQTGSANTRPSAGK
ncbi:MAG: hypothetical protein JW863_23930 [Chitinispirillaceae bacterium]|nr:hypothetical protein [Chitinispirillaceae bacterium]